MKHGQDIVVTYFNDSSCVASKIKISKNEKGYKSIFYIYVESNKKKNILITGKNSTLCVFKLS